MGMLDIRMRAVPVSLTLEQFVADIEARVRSLYHTPGEASPEGHSITILKPDDFEEQWSMQENLKQTPEVKEKYRKLTTEGRVVVLEVDW